MSLLRTAGAARLAASTGLGKPNHYAVRGSTILGDNRGPPQVGAVTEAMRAPTSPATVAQNFSEQQATATRVEPGWKLSRAALCGTCRQPLHPGPCRRPTQTPPQGSTAKGAEFNFGLHGYDAPAAATGDAGTARVRNDDPLMTASSAHRARQPGTVGQESTLPTGRWDKLSDEHRGPTENPYAERPRDLAQPSPETDVAATLTRLFGECADSFNNADGGAHPAGGPAV